MLDKLSALIAGELGKLSSGQGPTIPTAELQALLQSSFSRLNLVSREEFDAQTAVLLRTREKLEQLERQLAELETGSATPASID